MINDNNGWSPRLGDHKRDINHTNRSVEIRRKRERIKKLVKFFVIFSILLALVFLGQNLICNTVTPIL